MEFDSYLMRIVTVSLRFQHFIDCLFLFITPFSEVWQHQCLGSYLTLIFVKSREFRIELQEQFKASVIMFLSFQKACGIHFFFWMSKHDVTFCSQTMIG